MPTDNLVWWLILLLNFCSYFLFRFGMISRGNSKEYIEFLGGSLLFGSFVLMFILYGWGNGAVLIVVFMAIFTPLNEMLVRNVSKRLYGR